MKNDLMYDWNGVIAHPFGVRLAMMEELVRFLEL